MGIEPTSKAWEAFVLPLNYTRMTATLPFFYYTVLYSNRVGRSILNRACAQEIGARWSLLRKRHLSTILN